MSALEKIYEHYGKRRELAVPEWGFTLYWKPINALEQAEVTAMGKELKDTNLKSMIRMIVRKAEDQAGAKLFQPEDVDGLYKQADYMLINRVYGTMANLITPDDAVKN